MTIQSSKETAASFDARDYLLYLRGHWRLIAFSCAIAGALAFGEGLLHTPRYTSTASILIEAPAGNDSRIATSISPVYLESLRTYEVIGASDALFLQAVQKFQLRSSSAGMSIEALKARTLKVTKLRDTKVMQIAVTLPSPKDAQAMAQFLAEETVKLTSSFARESGADLVADARQHSDLAKGKVDELQSNLAKAASAQPVESLQAEIEPMLELLYRLKRTQAEAESDAAEADFRAKAPADAETPEERRGRAAEPRHAAALRARAEVAQKQAAALEAKIAAASKLLAERTTRLQQLTTDLKDAQKLFESASKRTQDMIAAVGLSAERLRLIDPGGIPERPSEPRVLLQTIAAIGVALLAVIVYLSFHFTFQP